MIEEEWLTSDDPERMRQLPAVASRQRKIRLWACACCRRIWHLVTDPRCHRSVEVAEEAADGIASAHELEQAYSEAIDADIDAHYHWKGVIEAAGGALGPAYEPHEGHSDAKAAVTAFVLASCIFHVPGSYPWHDDANSSGQWVTRAVAHAADPQLHRFTPSETPPRERARREEEAAQAALLRDIFGNPFRPVSVEPTWLSSTVTALATGIYADRAFDRMPILADALEEAGCDNIDVLNHCRGPGPHVLGCWVVDLLLGKE
jgi:hypothetical protein